jgi:hypothetical protein
VTRCGFLRRGRCERDCRARRQRSLTPTFAITLHLHGPRNTIQCVNSSLRTLLASIGPPQQRADPSRTHDELHTPSSSAREGRFPPAHCLRPPIGCCAPRSHCQPEQGPEDCGARWTDGMHLHAQRPDPELQLTITDHPQVGHAPAHPFLLRQRDHHGLYPPPVPHLHHVEIRPPQPRPPVCGSSLHQQAIEEELRPRRIVYN